VQVGSVRDSWGGEREGTDVGKMRGRRKLPKEIPHQDEKRPLRSISRDFFGTLTEEKRGQTTFSSSDQRERTSVSLSCSEKGGESTLREDGLFPNPPSMGESYSATRIIFKKQAEAFICTRGRAL